MLKPVSEKLDAIACDTVYTPVGEFSHDDDLLFTTPHYDSIPSINVFTSCVAGTCSFVHLIGQSRCQLKPCRAAQFLFGETALKTVDDSERLFLWQGLVKGFAIVDEDCPSAYNCPNYDSITGPEFYDEMSSLLVGELDSDKLHEFHL